jgi:hypothetical protein
MQRKNGGAKKRKSPLITLKESPPPKMHTPGSKPPSLNKRASEPPAVSLEEDTRTRYERNLEVMKKLGRHAR